MLLLRMLHVKSTVSCFIFKVTNYEPLVYYILLVCYSAQSTLKMYLFLKADATVSIFMIIMYTYLVSLTLFLCTYFTCICIHSTRCHVLYTVEFDIIILTAQYIDRGPPVTSPPPPPPGDFSRWLFLKPLNMDLLKSGCLHLSCWG